MTIPTSSNYPSEFDSETNLFVVHDSIRMKLAEDYNPGDKSILVSTDFATAALLPPTGLITLTEQCSELDMRAISFFYSSWDSTTNTISGLEILPGFVDNIKPKRITNVTVNVMDMHHNNLKNALIAIQEFCGVKGTIDKEPFGATLEGRINFLRKVVLQPKAWFTANKRTGNIPLEIEFQDMSFRLGTDGVSHAVTLTWDFGDETTSVVSVISVTDGIVPDDAINVLVRDSEVGGKIKKTYFTPGIYPVTLTVENDFGQDVCVFEDFINARIKAPNEAVIQFIEDATTQIATAGVPPNGPFTTPPTIRSPINTLINIDIPTGENSIGTPGYSYAGELLNNVGQPIDPVTNYTWSFGDDLNHPNSRETKASFSVGGFYNMKLRVDTQFGAYRITNYENAIDVVENTNMWMWIFSDNTTAKAYEYGLISETFKLINAPSMTVTRDDSFLDDSPTDSIAQIKHEFSRNTGFVPRSTTTSGLGGTSLLYWASGRGALDPISSEVIKVMEFDGFSGTYVSRSSITRPWNWANLNSLSNSYFIFGTVANYPPDTSPTNISKQTLSLSNLSVSSSNFGQANYINGSQELTDNVSIYDTDGNSVYGNYSVYRTAWMDSTGYIVRNDGVGPFFRLKSFYRTEGTVGTPFINIRKLQDIQGPTKLEGQLTNLSTGVYFLNNSGSVSKFSPDTSIWTSGGPGVNSLLYRGLQDTGVIGYDDQSNTLVVTSDGDKRAYMSFDYSENAFLKFSEIDLTFTSLGSRPAGEQFIVGVY